MSESNNTNLTLTLDRSQRPGEKPPPKSVKPHSFLRQSPSYIDIMASPNEVELTHDPSKRAGGETSATSVRSAKPQTYKAPAVTAVLQTNELLHLIIAEVPREYRTSLRHVSKSWKAVAEKIGHVLILHLIIGEVPLEHRVSIRRVSKAWQAAMFANEQVEDSSAAAVLQLPELLFMIISEVPREQRTSIRRVAKSWHAAVMKIGHAFEPSEYEPSTDDRVWALPMYSPHMTLKHNPAFASNPAWVDASSRMIRMGGRIWCQWLSFHAFRSATQLGELGSEFITDPPITQAKIHCGYVSLDVLLQVRDGIRVRDVLECFSEFRHLKTTRVSVLFGDETRRAAFGLLFPAQGEVESDSSDDESYEESEEGDDTDVAMTDTDNGDDSKSDEDDEMSD